MGWGGPRQGPGYLVIGSSLLASQSGGHSGALAGREGGMGMLVELGARTSCTSLLHGSV